ncbi:MAG TPA: SPOR domain-containing protein [Cerasibacillus sp.]|uniref:SPOR domain-containing protein n=1 Tax=Cerasibacillus sp. TaxID=2498711 RepID=UPI002F3F6DAE
MTRKKKLTFKINQKQGFSPKKQNIRKSRPSPSFNKRRQAFQLKKNVMIATGSALVIGTLLGIVMLKMFATVDESSAYQSTQVRQTAAPQQANHKKQPDKNNKTQSLSDMQAFVIQAGMFSERANAEAMLSQFQAKGTDGVIWQRDDHYYLFIDISSDKTGAKKMVESYKKENLETFVKQWATSEVSHSLTEVEQEWLTSFQTTWSDSVRAYTENKEIDSERWEQLYNKTNETKKMQDLFATTKSHLSDITKQPAVFLLNMWLAYEAFILSFEDDTLS